ncbi:hypothetical protein [Bacillus changyiensis]|uniref:hypothetical protein n=1 Tax=Bacillus changyiensis TaxID=3004103 RepID=UPI0022E55E62|nr:hypothetical protein [Bacillus changyiensis]MDA1476657.1 hypothetical protein [Bacillus changyiensis]
MLKVHVFSTYLANDQSYQTKLPEQATRHVPYHSPPLSDIDKRLEKGLLFVDGI